MEQLCCGYGFNKMPPDPKLILDQEQIISTCYTVDFGPYYTAPTSNSYSMDLSMHPHS